MTTIAMPVHRLIALSVLVTIASGCIPVGVPLPPESDPFTERKLDFIETGTTTKDDIRLALSESPFELAPQVFNGGKIWVYSMEKKGWGGAGCIMVGGGYSGDIACGSERVTTTHLLLLRFNDQGIVDYWFDAEGRRASFSHPDITAIAEFDLEFQKDGSGVLTHDGRKVEVAQVNHVDEVRFKGKDEILLVVDGQGQYPWREIYFGDVTPVRDAATKPKGESHYLIDASTFEEMTASLL